MLGYIFAVISSLFFSLYVVPRKLSTLSPVIFSLFMSLGFSACSIVLYLFQPLIKFHETISLLLCWSIVAGAIWATSFVLLIRSIDTIGLSRSNQWKNLQGPIAVVLSLLILGESATTNPFFAILAAISIFLSAIFLSSTLDSNKGIKSKGIYLAVISAFGFGSVAIIQKYVTSHVGVYSQQVVWSLSIATSLMIYIFLSKKAKEIARSSRKELFIGLTAGILYLGASLFQLLSYKYLPASITFTIIQMSALWTVAIGIFVFREINLKKYSKAVSLGLAFTIIGIVFLVFARK